MDVYVAVDSSLSECGIERLQLGTISLQRLKSHMHDNRLSLLSFMFLAVCKDDIDSSKFQLKCARLVNN